MVEKLAYSAKEVAEMLGLSEWKVRELCYHGELRSLKAGHRLLIPKTAVNEFLNPEPEIDPWEPEAAQ